MSMDPDHEFNTLLSFYARAIFVTNRKPSMLSKSRSITLPVLELPPPTKFVRKQNRTARNTFAAFETGPSAFENHRPSSPPSGPIAEHCESQVHEMKHNPHRLSNYDLLLSSLMADYPDSLPLSNHLNSE